MPTPEAGSAVHGDTRALPGNGMCAPTWLVLNIIALHLLLLFFLRTLLRRLVRLKGADVDPEAQQAAAEEEKRRQQHEQDRELYLALKESGKHEPYKQTK